MPVSEVAPYRNPLDVLWRGVPVLFRADVRLAGVNVSVESNDSELLALVTGFAAVSKDPSESNFLWRIVRDTESLGAIEPAVMIEREELAFATMSAAVVVGVDRERKELLAFVGVNVDESAFKETVFPLFERMTLRAFEPLAPSGRVQSALGVKQNHTHE